MDHANVRTESTLAVAWLACALLLAVAPGAGAGERDEEAQPLPPGTQKCVNITRIRKTRIIDDSTILFYMQGGKVYVNHLPRRCSGLRSAGSFSYKTSVSSLCDVDIITVIRPTTPVVRGPSCGLGTYQPISEEEIQLLLAAPAPEADNEAVAPEIEPLDGGDEGGAKAGGGDGEDR
ncbi:MAG: hypothetical protein D6727_01565 [Gammaproteobacteria bacterium]|nr:MAG: hypothetical protein D6727_01565 [Gammaproteobacteria bacterium]